MIPTFAPGAVEHILPQVGENVEPIVESQITFELVKEREWRKVRRLGGYLLRALIEKHLKLKNMRNFLSFLIATILLTSCATSGRINRINVGMTKNQVISTMGNPKSISAIGNIEFLNYKLAETTDDAWRSTYTDYYVKIVNGVVESYGRLGDFDSTKDPTINVNTDSKFENVGEKNESNKEKMYEELLKIKELLDKGIITKEEYEKEKKEILEKY
jgi:hypothetical protein